MSTPSSLPTRPLGRNGPSVTALGIGLMGLSIAYGPPLPDAERFAFLDAVYASGQRFFDSADAYGDNEDILGQWFRQSGKRDEIFLATKFALTVGADGALGVRNDAEYVREACAKSLKRLGVEKVDLFYCHRVDKEVPIEETVGVMKELRDEGKIGLLGLSEISADTLRRAYKVCPIAAVQIEYSPFTMDIEDPKIGLLEACRELGVAVVAYSPLGRGFLTGRYRSADDFEDGDFRKYVPRFSHEHFGKNLELVDTLKAIAEKKGITVGQLTLAFLMAQGDDIIPIPGTTKIKNFEENMGALKVKVSEEENKEIRKAISSAEVRGGRYPDAMMNSLFADTAPLKK